MLRLILYFPISALVTIFANILQNPQDARARSDVKLMGLVVNFLSMLVADESNGSVRRMLGVCSEFERIAKVVLEKAEKESQSKRKRRAGGDENNNDDVPAQAPSNDYQARSAPDVQARNATPKASLPTQTFQGNSGTPPTSQTDREFYFSQQSNMEQESSPSAPATTATTTTTSTTTGAKFGHGYDQDFSEMLTPNQLNPNAFTGGGPSFSNPSQMPVDFSSFQQPFVPQELWQMPMTLEWDWADVPSSFPFANGDEHQG